MEDEERMTNLGALTEALAVSTVVPWLICLAAFTALHFTYQRDVQYARLLFFPMEKPHTEKPKVKHKGNEALGVGGWSRCRKDREGGREGELWRGEEQRNGGTEGRTEGRRTCGGREGKGEE
eukprot:1901168-Rhodomonas_salina.2